MEYTSKNEYLEKMIDKYSNMIYRLALIRTKTKENITGYRENSEGLIKYEINNEGIFQINMDEKVPLENLYLGLNENYLDIQKIYDLTSTLTENINEEENEIIYENDNIGIIFKIDEQNILSINIKDNNDNYLLEFDNIK